MQELRPGERYCFHLEGGACVEALVCQANEQHVVLAPPDVVPWSARLILARRKVYRAERVWQPRPRPVDPDAIDWESDRDWLVWRPGSEAERLVRKRRKAKVKPLFPDAVEAKAPRQRKPKPVKKSKATIELTQTTFA